MRKTIKIPDSDRTARQATDESNTNLDTETGERQTSNKTGKHSSAEKLAASRPEFGSRSAAHPVSGAKGDPEEPSDEHTPSGSHRDKALKP